MKIRNRNHEDDNKQLTCAPSNPLIGVLVAAGQQTSRNFDAYLDWLSSCSSELRLRTLAGCVL